MYNMIRIHRLKLIRQIVIKHLTDADDEVAEHINIDNSVTFFVVGRVIARLTVNTRSDDHVYVNGDFETRVGKRYFTMTVSENFSSVSFGDELVCGDLLGITGGIDNIFGDDEPIVKNFASELAMQLTAYTAGF